MKKMTTQEIREELKKINCEIMKIPPLHKPSFEERSHSRKLWTAKRKLMAKLNHYNYENA